MSFLEERLDPRISFGAKGGPKFSTLVPTSAGGARFPTRLWTYPLHAYDITQSLRTNADFDTVRALFWNVYGRFDAFRYKDWADFQTKKTTGTLSLISGSNYQLQKVYSTALRSMTRNIVKTVTGTEKIYNVSDTLLTATVDATTGIATVTGTPSYWIGEFDVPVAFVDDQLLAELIDRGDDILVAAPVKLEEVRL